MADIDLDAIAREALKRHYPDLAFANPQNEAWLLHHERAIAETTVAAIEAAGYTITRPVPAETPLTGEPGPQVTSVRDRDGSVWDRTAAGWRLRDHGFCADVSWSWVARYAPLYAVDGA